MTLLNAIKYYEGKAKYFFSHGQKEATVEALRLVGWLLELKEFRETDPDFPKIDVTSKLM